MMQNYVFITDLQDNRTVRLKRLLEQDGYIVQEFGENPFDFSAQSVYVFSPATVLTLEIAARIKSNSIVFANRLGESVEEEFFMRRITYQNIMQDERFTMQNAVLTAEGALEILLKETEFALEEFRVMVLGYGRIGKAMTHLLTALDCPVTVATHNPREEAMSVVFAPDAVPFPRFEERLAGHNIFINTMPVPVLTDAVLRKLPDNALVLDLASAPGGTDFPAAKQLGIKAIHALGIPGIYAPNTAARYLQERILRELNTD